MTDSASPIVDGLSWLNGLLTGSLPLTIAAIGIAGLGLALLSGRVSVRRAFTVITGCFVLLGAQGIARGLIGFGSQPAPTGIVAQQSLPEASPPAAQKVRRSDDPYAGASLAQ